jgi:hypothetical protein
MAPAGGGSEGRRVGIEPSGRVSQVAAAHDVVAFEHGTRFVAGELHGHALRHACPHEVMYANATMGCRWTGRWCSDTRFLKDDIEIALLDPDCRKKMNDLRTFFGLTDMSDAVIELINRAHREWIGAV